MSKVKLNKKSVKQQGGAMIPSQPAMSNQQQQVDPMVKQVTELISTSVNQGKEIVDVIIELSQQQVDQQVIAQALMMGGMQQEDVVTLFEQVQVKMQPPGPSSPNEVNNSPELLARNEYLEQQNSNEDGMNPMAKSGIEIKPENKGKFTAWAKARGMSVQEAASKVMANKDNYPPSVVKMANFAKNAAGWKKEEGGEPDNKGFRALPDFVQNKIMKRQTGGEEETETDKSKLTDEQKSENEMRQKFLEASNVTLTNQKLPKLTRRDS
mgnify:CR=1 FL=1